MIESFIYALYGVGSREEVASYFHTIVKSGAQTVSKLIIVSMAGIIVNLVVAIIKRAKFREELVPLLIMITVMGVLYKCNLTLTIDSIPTKSTFSKDTKYFSILVFFHVVLAIFLLFFIFDILHKDPIYSGLYIGLYFVTSVFGVIAIFRSFLLSLYVEILCLLLYVISSKWHKTLLDYLPICLVVAIFLLFAIHQIDAYSINNFKFSNQLTIEHHKMSLFFESTNNAIAILSVSQKLDTASVDYYNNTWGKHPFSCANSNALLQVLKIHSIKEQGSVYDVIQTMITLSPRGQGIIKKTYNVDVYKGTEYFNYKIDISLISNTGPSNLIFLQYIDNTRSIELAQLKVKEKMMCSLTHELFTPLNTILAISDKQSISELNKESLTMLNINANILYLKIKDFICYSEYITGKLYIENDYVNLIETFRKVISLYASDAASKQVSVELCITKDVPTLIWCDRVRVMQIMNNLISNAIKYTQKLGRIEITATYIEGVVDVSVVDNGAGFDIRQYKEGKLIGMGITIMNFICKELGTKLNVISKIGNGSKFWFQIFCIRKEENELGGCGSSDSLNTILKESSILSISKLEFGFIVADDIFFNRLTVRTMLNSISVNSTIYDASNGSEVLEIVKEHYDRFAKIMVFMDIEMPIMDGFECTHALTQWKQNQDVFLVIIGITAFSICSYIDQCKKCGMAEAFTKPISIGQLKECIKRNGMGKCLK